MQRTFPAYVGIDPSLTNTGIAIRHTGATTNWQPGPPHTTRISSVKSTGKKIDSWDTRGKRINTIIKSVVDHVPEHSLVVIESPSYGSQGGFAHDRSGVWWGIHAGLTRNACTVICAAPTQRMKYVTGHGRADKDKVLAHTIRRYPNLDITNNNTADAVIFMAMAARLAGQPIENGTSLKTMDEVIEKLATQLEDN